MEQKGLYILHAQMMYGSGYHPWAFVGMLLMQKNSIKSILYKNQRCRGKQISTPKLRTLLTN